MSDLRVIQLRAENIKRLTAINIVLNGDENLVTIAGRNDQGKSSVIDAIAMALGGKALTPKQPIKGDGTRGEVFLDLGTYKVTRTFTRERAACDCAHGAGAVQHLADCASLTKWGPIDSALTVRSEDGAKYSSPQTLLTKLVGDLSFDPLKFLEMEPDDQAKTLRKLAGLDTTAIDEQYRAVFDERTIVNRDVKTLQATFDAFVHYPDAPAEEISVESLMAEIRKADIARRDAEALERDAEQAIRDRAAAEQNYREAIRLVERLTKELAAAKSEMEELEKAHLHTMHQADELGALAEGQRKLVPDVTAIEAKIREANDTNAKVRANEARANAEKRLNARKVNAAEATKLLEELTARKAKMLSEAKFPIAGLSLSDDGPTFDGRLLAQASTAAKLRVSVAMGLALNPKLKVLLVHEGNDLDDDSLKLLAELATEAGAQVWLERIAGNKDGVSIVIEDGAVKA